MQASIQEEIARILADKDKVQYTISQMIALMNDTNSKVEAMKSQKWFQRMIKTVLGKNKATKEEIASNHDKLNAYMAEAVAELFKRSSFAEDQLVSLSSQINQVYENIPEIKEMLFDSVMTLNDKIVSLDSYVVLTQKITVGNYSETDEICILFDVVSRIDNRVAMNEEKTSIIHQMLATKLNFQVKKPLSDYLRSVFNLGRDRYENLYSNAVSIGSGSIWVRLVMQAIEQYHFLPTAEKKALAIDAVLEKIVYANTINSEIEFSLSEIFDDLLDERINQAENAELSSTQSDVNQKNSDNTEEALAQVAQEKLFDEVYPKPREDSFHDYYALAESGDANAQCMVGRCYYDGIGIEKDIKQAVEWYSKAAEQGHADAQNRLGVRYDNGDGVEENEFLAAKLFERAALQGHAKAQCNLGKCYFYGRGLAEDNEEAFRWFSLSAEQNIADAQYFVGKCYFSGYGVKEDDKQAVVWFEKAAANNQPRAQFFMGQCYFHGLGVMQDNSKAELWFENAANQGDSEAQFFLGGMLLEKDAVKGINWIKKSAEQDFALAQYFLGQCYATGLGVEKNPVEAVHWYKKAAEQQEPNALLKLGICYMYGTGDGLLEKNCGVIKDLRLAYDSLSRALAESEISGFIDDEDTALVHRCLAEVLYAQNVRDNLTLGALDYVNCIPGPNLVSILLTGVRSASEKTKLRNFLTTEDGRKMMYHCKTAAEMGNKQASDMLKILNKALR